VSYPVSVLSPTLSALCRRTYGPMLWEPLCGIALLAVGASLLRGRVRAQIGDALVPADMAIIVAAASGTGKSAVLEEVLGPVLRVYATHREQALNQKVDYEIAQDNVRRLRQQMQRARGAEVDILRVVLADAESRLVEPERWEVLANVHYAKLRPPPAGACLAVTNGGGYERWHGHDTLVACANTGQTIALFSCAMPQEPRYRPTEAVFWANLNYHHPEYAQIEEAARHLNPVVGESHSIAHLERYAGLVAWLAQWRGTTDVPCTSEATTRLSELDELRRRRVARLALVLRMWRAAEDAQTDGVVIEHVDVARGMLCDRFFELAGRPAPVPALPQKRSRTR